MTLCACDALQLFASCVALARDDVKRCRAAHALPQRARAVKWQTRLERLLACRYILAFTSAFTPQPATRPLQSALTQATRPLDTHR